MQCGRGCGPWGRACPFPLPPASGGAGPVRSLRALLWTCSVPLFCKRPTVCLGWLIFSLSFAVPQFKLVTHKSSLQLSSGHSGPVLTLSNASGSSPFRLHLLVVDVGVSGTFLLRVAFRHVICGFYLLFPSQSGCPLRFKNFPQTHQCKTPFPGRISILSSFVSLFIFSVLSYLL